MHATSDGNSKYMKPNLQIYKEKLASPYPQPEISTPFSENLIEQVDIKSVRTDSI